MSKNSLVIGKRSSKLLPAVKASLTGPVVQSLASHLVRA
jgi:hypothetical protein